MAGATTYAIRGMVCHRCDLAVADAAEALGVPVVRVARGEVAFARALSPPELAAFGDALEALRFGLIRDRDEAMAEALEVALARLAARDPVPSWADAHEELRRGLAVPYDYAARAYARLRGRSPRERLTELRLARAAQLLREGELHAGEVATATGYAHLSGLSRAFKRAYGVNPSAWRGP